MKILVVDNYDRGIYEPIVIAENVHPSFANRIARLLNEDEEEMHGMNPVNYYMVKEA